jgi:hypothetical protein
VGNAGVGFTTANIDRPLAKDRRVDQRLAPQRLGDPGVAVAQVLESLVLDESDLARSEGGQTCGLQAV